MGYSRYAQVSRTAELVITLILLFGIFAFVIYVTTQGTSAITKFFENLGSGLVPIGIVIAFPMIEDFRKKRSQKVGKAIAAGSMLLNVILILVILSLAVIIIIFIKGGVESVMETWKSIT
jgi:zinc transporter ZupT